MAAVAIFVKTPGLSPLKTRLASGIGLHAAQEFYRLSVEAVRAVIRTVAKSPSIQPFWAVAEPEGLSHSLWSDFEQVPQPAGQLGHRLAGVYARLREAHEHIVFIGADSPQITAREIREALQKIESPGPEFALGRCPDGGFYLFAGRVSVPDQIWRDTPWSSPETAAEFARKLSRIGQVADLPVLCDVDVAADLPRLHQELSRIDDLLPEQLTLLRWLDSLGNIDPSSQ